MENIKNYWTNNLSDKAKIIIISFFTFLSFICASMTNSIVSAYDVKFDNKTYNYKYYVKYTTLRKTDKYTQTSTYIFYFNDWDSTYINSDGRMELRYKGADVPTHYYTKTKTVDSNGIVSTSEYVKSFSTVVITYQPYVYANSVSDLSTNNQQLYSTIHSYNNEVKFNPELISPEKMKPLTGTISKTMAILIPIGLVIFGAILGIYLIKRLVALFL